MAPFTIYDCLLHLDLHTQQIALLPTSTEELSIPPALLFTKDKTHGIIMIDSDSNGKVNTESKLIVYVNSVGNMDRGTMMFTSDVSLPKYDKIAMRVKQITAGQLTGLCAQTNANYAKQKGRGSKEWAVRQDKYTEIHLHLPTNHPPCDIYPEHLAGI